MISMEEKQFIADYVREKNINKVNCMDLEVHLQNTIYSKYIKRVLDILISLICLIIVFPVNMILALCTFIDVGFPIFFRQVRPGKDGSPFLLIKFRNMTNETDEYGNLLPINKRVTKFGAFVRKYSLDELLNFWSILKGDMSVIGPRPLAEVYVNRYSKRHHCRHAVRPGLECPNIEKKGYSSGWHEQFENDVWYVENVSFVNDCKAFFFLIRMVFDQKERKRHAVIGVGDFIGYDEDGVAFGANEIPDKYSKLLEEIRK